MALRLPYILVGGEIVLLGAFFVSVWIGDSFLPERGGSGDAQSIYLWSGRAGLAFWLLAALWVVAMVRLAFLVFRRRQHAASSIATNLGGIDAVSAGFPLFGLVLGYTVLLLFR